MLQCLHRDRRYVAMELVDILELYINASEEVKNQVDLLLEEQELPTGSPE